MPAVTTDADVCNMALGHVGQRRLILSLIEDSAEAIACRTHYATAKREILETHWWSWATKRQALAQLMGVTREGWGYVYAAPADLISADGARFLDEGRGAAEPAPFIVELNDSGSALIIATDLQPATLVYTRDVPVALWPAKAITALSYELAHRLALSLPVKPGLAQGLVPMASLKLDEARAADMNAAGDEAPQPAADVRLRGYTGG